MKSVSIYPQEWDGEALTIDRDILIAVVYPGAGEGHLEVLVPTYEEQLRALFERPVILRDRMLFPWSAEAVKYALETGLAPMGLYGEQDP